MNDASVWPLPTNYKWTASVACLTCNTAEALRSKDEKRRKKKCKRRRKRRRRRKGKRGTAAARQVGGNAPWRSPSPEPFSFSADAPCPCKLSVEADRGQLTGASCRKECEQVAVSAKNEVVRAQSKSKCCKSVQLLSAPLSFGQRHLSGAGTSLSSTRTTNPARHGGR